MVLKEFSITSHPSINYLLKAALGNQYLHYSRKSELLATVVLCLLVWTLVSENSCCSFSKAFLVLNTFPGRFAYSCTLVVDSSWWLLCLKETFGSLSGIRTVNNSFLGPENKNTGFYTDNSFKNAFFLVLQTFFWTVLGIWFWAGSNRNVERERYPCMCREIQIHRYIDVWKMIGIDCK